MKNLESEQIRAFLDALGKRYPYEAQLYLLSGSALCLLGSPRPTLDVDYIGNDLNKDGLGQVMEEIAREMGLDVEAVPIDRFMPVPSGGRERSLHIGAFGKVEVYIFDPYSIALSKIDRGFDTDIDDVVFLLQRGLIDLEELERIARNSLTRAREFDMLPAEMLAYLQAVRARLT
ncbi:MAG: hypothetical protein KKC71_05965 [Chloroflexi bacterium]|nr:hypothetical protein [Chloroflexota bacterium]